MTQPPWSERVPPDEAARFEKLATQLRALQHRRIAGGAPTRGLHAKANAAARATLSTLPNLPDWARVGIFAQPTTLPALVRFSNGSGTPAKDKVPDVRGMAVKVIGVPGTKLIPGLEGAKTQDFLGILTPSMPFRTPDAFVGLVLALGGPKILALPRLIAALGWGDLLPTLKKLKAGLDQPTPPLAEATYYSAAPIRWGETAVKFSLAPRPSKAPSVLASRDDPEALGTELIHRLSEQDLSWDLRIQRFVDEARTPIEDVMVAWEPGVAPWVTVARLTLPRQDLRSPEARERARRVERLSFDPWHAPVEFRPLGAFMRARASAYRESVMERGVDAEPEGTEPWLNNG